MRWFCCWATDRGTGITRWAPSASGDVDVGRALGFTVGAADVAVTDVGADVIGATGALCATGSWPAQPASTIALNRHITGTSLRLMPSPRECTTPAYRCN